jgi:tRNA threonylcarbamoyladenosine biosynthesis protein TsaE
MDREALEIISKNSKDTFRLGKRLADLLKSGDIVALYGELGSGKTVFAQGICAGLGVNEYVTSPSFTLIHEYRGRVQVFHIDFYRLESDREVESLDVVHYWESGGIVLIEWADRGELFLPDDRISVYFNRIQKNGEIVIEERVIRLIGPQGRGLVDLGA